MFSCLCTEKDSHSKCEKLERFVSVIGVVLCCCSANAPCRGGNVRGGANFPTRALRGGRCCRQWSRVLR